MHSTLTRRRHSIAGISCITLLAVVAGASAQQTTVDAITTATASIQRAEAFLRQGQRDSAMLLMNRHLTEQPNDGRAWFFFGRIFLTNVQQWHRAGHPADSTSSGWLDFASASFEEAQRLLTDSGGVMRVLVAMERATMRIEKDNWDSVSVRKLPAEDLPLPPVVAELGHNLLASCPRNGVMLVASLTESAAAWGVRLLGERRDLILLRPDMYQWDARYRSHMAPALGVDANSDLPAALAAAAATRPICLAPGVDSIVAPGLTWRANRLVLTTAPAPAPGSFVAPLNVFYFGRTGLTGSVWTASVRDEYDLATRRNHALCTTLFVNTDALTLPAIPACTQ